MKNKDNEPIKPDEFSDNYKRRSIAVFSSFEDQELYEIQKNNSLSPEERIEKLEKLRKIFLKQYLLPNGNWPSLSRTISIHNPKAS